MKKMEIIAYNSIFMSPSENVKKFITLFIFTIFYVCLQTRQYDERCQSTYKRRNEIS